MKTFDEVFKNPKTITRNPKLLLQRTEDPSLTIKDAQEYLDKSAAVQVTMTHKINKKLFSKIVAYYPNQQIYMDFMNYDRFSYKKYRYIFCYVDTYSRFAVAIPMKTRNHQTLAPVLERIFAPVCLEIRAIKLSLICCINTTFAFNSNSIYSI